MPSEQWNRDKPTELLRRPCLRKREQLQRSVYESPRKVLAARYYLRVLAVRQLQFMLPSRMHRVSDFHLYLIGDSLRQRRAPMDNFHVRFAIK